MHRALCIAAGTSPVWFPIAAAYGYVATMKYKDWIRARRHRAWLDRQPNPEGGPYRSQEVNNG